MCLLITSSSHRLHANLQPHLLRPWVLQESAIITRCLKPEHLQVRLGARSHLQLAAEGPAVGVQAAAAAAAVGQAGSAEAFGRPAGR